MSQPAATFAPDADKTPQQLGTERQKRLLDAIELRQPDRIPLLIRLGYLLAEMGNMTRLEVHQNPAKATAELIKISRRFQPDIISAAGGSPEPSRLLGDQSTRWPGYGLDENGSFQYAEQEFMKAEDYDDFIEDPADFALRRFLPRVFTALDGLSLLPRLGMACLGYYGVVFNLGVFTDPRMVKTLEALTKAAQTSAETFRLQREGAQKMAEAGFPDAPMPGPLMSAPFDFMSDTLRGMRGIFTDMRRYPEKLLAAEAKASTLMLKHCLEFTAPLRQAGIKCFAHFPLHRGDDNFISVAQFEKFYWPQLRDMFLKLIENGITPFVFYEGQWNKRLKYIAELPKGKSVAHFHDSDIFKAKEIVGETACIMGGMPVSLLVGGTPKEVRERTKQVCEVCGKGGGFIMTTGASELEGCNSDLVQVWADATREFGVY